MTLWSVWWVWLSAALALATLEVIVAGHVCLAVALGAVVVALLLLVWPAAPLIAALAVLVIVSVPAWLLLRRKRRARKVRTQIWDRGGDD